MLVLTFEDNEDAMMNRILSLINTKEEVIQMSGMNEHLLNFKGLMIDEVQGFPFSKAISEKWKHSRERTSRQGSRTGLRNTKTQFNHSVRCMENRKDFMHLFSLGKGDLWNRQKSRQRAKNSVRISKRKSEELPTTWQFISAKRAGKP